jgi:thiol-disulfide isomerase/thioredoxin
MCNFFSKLLIIFALFFFEGKVVTANELERLRVFDPAVKISDFYFFDGQGKKISLREFKGYVVVLNIWATWCPSCISEMPSLDRLAKNIKDDNVLVIAVSQDAEGSAIVKPYWEKLAIENLVAYIDTAGLAQKFFSTRGLPTTIFLSKKTEVVGIFEGSLDWDSINVVNYLKKINRLD